MSCTFLKARRGAVKSKKMASAWLQAGGTLAGLALAAGLGAAGLLAEPASGDAMKKNASRIELENFAGAAPDRCVYSAPGRELCRWRVEGRVIRPGRTDAPGVVSGVNLVCELPIDPASPARGACDVHALEPGATAELAANDPALPPVSAPRPEAILKPMDPIAVARVLGDARTVRELSKLLGDVPQSCLTGRGVQTCRWQISDEGVGEMLFAGVAGLTRAVELQCRLPLDGGPRPADSCLVMSEY
jgi:hypothetical protein